MESEIKLSKTVHFLKRFADLAIKFSKDHVVELISNTHMSPKKRLNSITDLNCNSKKAAY